jgi:hypothetical protein
MTFSFLSSKWIGDCKSERELVIKLYLPDFSRINLNNILTDYTISYWHFESICLSEQLPNAQVYDMSHESS